MTLDDSFLQGHRYFGSVECSVECSYAAPNKNVESTKDRISFGVSYKFRISYVSQA